MINLIHLVFVFGVVSSAERQFFYWKTREKRQQGLPEDTFVPVVTVPIFTGRAYEYGPEFGDLKLAAEVDSVQLILLAKPILLFETSYDFAYVMSNGGIGLELTTNRYTSRIFANNSKPIIAPFWSRNDLRKGGKVYFREIIEGPVLERGEREIRYQYDITATPKSALVVTWENMQPFKKGIVLPPEHTNSFQAVIFMTDRGTFVNFIYIHIGWSLGAKAGFSGAGATYHSLPSSGTKNIIYLEEHGNNGIPGEWIFQIDRKRIIRCKPGIKGDLCNKECGKKEWGYDCSNCCHCDGRCKGDTGECLSKNCSSCWFGEPRCDQRDPFCELPAQTCASNAVSFTDFDNCGEPVTRCQCQEGYTGDGYKSCRVMPLFWWFHDQNGDGNQ